MVHALADLPDAEPVGREPRIAVLQDGILKLFQRLPDDAEPRVFIAVLAGRLHQGAPQEFDYTRRRLARANGSADDAAEGFGLHEFRASEWRIIG